MRSVFTHDTRASRHCLRAGGLQHHDRQTSSRHISWPASSAVPSNLQILSLDTCCAGVCTSSVAVPQQAQHKNRPCARQQPIFCKFTSLVNSSCHLLLRVAGCFCCCAAQTPNVMQHKAIQISATAENPGVHVTCSPETTPGHASLLFQVLHGM
jgi:hypothetical protein